MSHLLEVKGLCKEYDGFALQDINFVLPKGSIMGLIGENGAGKTTTIKLLLDQIARTAGEVSIFGMDNIKDQKKIKQDIGTVFEENFFYQDLKPLDIAKILRAMFGKWDDALFSRYLERFQLPKNKRIKEFSRGMKMKLSIASALSRHPKLLILDEATSGLDPVVRGEILDVFLDFIQDEECGVLLSSHITSDLERVADYITFIHKGRVVFSESKDEVLERYGVAHCKLGERIDPQYMVSSRENRFGKEILVKNKEQVEREYRDMVIDSASLDDIMTYYAQEGKQ